MSRRQVVLLCVAVLSTAAVATGVTETANEAAPAPPPPPPRSCPLPAGYRGAFAAAARENGLPLGLLAAVAWEESRYDPTAHSKAGALGLLQVLPTTGAELRLDVQDPRANVFAGARYLHRMLDRFDAPDLALAAYNAGPEAVARARAVPDFARTYVEQVNARWRALRRCR